MCCVKQLVCSVCCSIRELALKLRQCCQSEEASEPPPCPPKDDPPTEPPTEPPDDPLPPPLVAGNSGHSAIGLERPQKSSQVSR